MPGLQREQSTVLSRVLELSVDGSPTSRIRPFLVDSHHRDLVRDHFNSTVAHGIPRRGEDWLLLQDLLPDSLRGFTWEMGFCLCFVQERR